MTDQIMVGGEVLYAERKPLYLASDILEIGQISIRASVSQDQKISKNSAVVGVPDGGGLANGKEYKWYQELGVVINWYEAAPSRAGSEDDCDGPGIVDRILEAEENRTPLSLPEKPSGTHSRVDSGSQSLAGAGPPAHEGASAPYAPVGRYPFE